MWQGQQLLFLFSPFLAKSIYKTKLHASECQLSLFLHKPSLHKLTVWGWCPERVVLNEEQVETSVRNITCRIIDASSSQPAMKQEWEIKYQRRQAAPRRSLSQAYAPTTDTWPWKYRKFTWVRKLHCERIYSTRRNYESARHSARDQQPALQQRKPQGVSLSSAPHPLSPFFSCITGIIAMSLRYLGLNKRHLPPLFNLMYLPWKEPCKIEFSWCAKCISPVDCLQLYYRPPFSNHHLLSVAIIKPLAKCISYINAAICTPQVRTWLCALSGTIPCSTSTSVWMKSDLIWDCFSTYSYFLTCALSIEGKDTPATAVDFCVAVRWFFFVRTAYPFRLFLEMPGKEAFLGNLETFCEPKGLF